ncbi:MCE family protein [uncultured Jatrophihabitans sp.]|uniref:MCE family protein n=1 Tax=uncultured Jatrophihabitans sp. TaxID=1610747 RepID=UPI0035C9494E
MAGESFGAVVKRRLLGLTFIVVVIGLISLSIAIYNKAFTSFTDVTLKSDFTGNELQKDSDVKLDGLIVGSVATIDSSGSGAIVKMKLDPDKAKQIPADVTARILPKTLFGEQYVALSSPKGLVGPSNPAIKNGGTIAQDRSKGALEAQKVLSDFYPLLTAVHPEQLDATLTALATALRGRGNELGETLVNFDKYLKVMNPHTKQLVADLKSLGQVALEYHNVLPDVYSTLQNFETGARTVVEKQAQLSSLLTSGAQTSDVLRGFLAENEQRIIAVSDQTNKIFPLLQRYSPEFSCLATGINNLYKGAVKAIYNHQIHLFITVANPNDRKPYTQGQEPRNVTGYGANCFGLPTPQKPFQIPGKYRCLNDGAPLTNDACAQRGSDADDKALNSSAENAYVSTLISGSMHTTPNKVPGVATYLAGPLLRGQQVVAK